MTHPEQEPPPLEVNIDQLQLALPSGAEDISSKDVSQPEVKAKPEKRRKVGKQPADSSDLKRKRAGAKAKSKTKGRSVEKGKEKHVEEEDKDEECDGEDEEEGEEEKSSHDEEKDRPKGKAKKKGLRDQSKSKKFSDIFESLPPEIQDCWEKSSRAGQTKMINEGVVREGGKLLVKEDIMWKMVAEREETQKGKEKMKGYMEEDRHQETNTTLPHLRVSPSLTPTPQQNK